MFKENNLRLVTKVCSTVAVIFCVSQFCLSQSTGVSTVTWATKDEILKRIIPPAFPNKDFVVSDFGAVGNGKKDCTKAFQKAIEKCHASGGGRVVVSEGIYLTGAITLKSHVNLHLSKNAIVKFSTDPQKYLPVVYCRWEGIECMNYSPLIYAYEQEDIAITGEGVLDGQGSDENWWSWKGRKIVDGKPNQTADRNQLVKWGEENSPVEQRVFGEGHYLRPNFFEPYKCKNVLVEGVTFKNSPMWFLNPVLCTNVSVQHVTTEGLGPNNDGCDPECCTDVLIHGCYFNNGDDCIAIKSGRNNDGRRVNIACSNIIVENSQMKNGHGGVSIGSEISGNIRNVFVENDTMDSPNLDRMLRIKTNAIRGGIVENVFVRNVKVGQVADAVMQIDFYYEEGDKGEFTPIVRNVELKNVESGKSKYGVWIRAYDRSPATNIRRIDCTFNNVAQANVIENVKEFASIGVKLQRSKAGE
jgi:polygalacturonase